MQEQQLAMLVEPILAEAGLELDSLEVTPIGKRRLLRITVDGDGPRGRGPVLDDISAASLQHRRVSRRRSMPQRRSATPPTRWR